MSEYTTKDAVNFALNQDPSKFRDAIGDLLANKLKDHLDLKRVEVASQFMSAEEDEVEVQQQDDADFEPDNNEGESDGEDSEV